MAQNYVPAANRLVELYAPPDDAERIDSDDADTLARYLQLMAFRESDGRRLAAADSAARLALMAHQLEASDLAKEASDLAAEGNERARQAAGVDPEMDVGDAEVLGIFRREPWGLFVLAEVDAEAVDEPRSRWVSASAIIIADQQMMLLIAFSKRDSNADVVWARDAVSAWADAIRTANP